MLSLVWKGGWQGKGREAGQFQEHDHVCDLPFHHTQHHQTNELIAVGLSLLPVKTESRAAIGARRKQAPVPSRNADPSRESCGDGCSSLEPDGKWRHGEPGVLSQQRHQARDVRLLPARHIAVKQGLDLRDWESGLFLWEAVVLLPSASGSLDTGIDSSDREVEPFGYLAGRPSQHLAQEKNGPLRWR